MTDKMIARRLQGNINETRCEAFYAEFWASGKITHNNNLSYFWDGNPKALEFGDIPGGLVRVRTYTMDGDYTSYFANVRLDQKEYDEVKQVLVATHPVSGVDYVIRAVDDNEYEQKHLF